MALPVWRIWGGGSTGQDNPTCALRMGEASSSLNIQRSKQAQPHKPEIILTFQVLQGPALGQDQKEKSPSSFSMKGEERSCTLGTVKLYTRFLGTHF